MADPEYDFEAYMDAAAMLIGLPIAPEQRQGVVQNLERIAQMAALVEAFPLPDEIEPSPMFRA